MIEYLFDLLSVLTILFGVMIVGYNAVQYAKGKYQENMGIFIMFGFFAIAIGIIGLSGKFW